MEIGALLKTAIYLIATSLLYPVLFLLVFLTIWVIVYCGSVFAEWIERLRLQPLKPDDIAGFGKGTQESVRYSHRVKSYLERLCELREAGSFSELEVENLYRETALKIWKSMDRLRILVRVAPGLGLIGTLIPMGTGLAALGQGDMSKLTSDLVIAFTTTVVGLALGIVSFFFYTIKRRWVEEDIKNMELVTEILTEEKENRHEVFHETTPFRKTVP